MANLTMPTFMTKWYVTFVFVFQVSPSILLISHPSDRRDLNLHFYH